MTKRVEALLKEIMDHGLVFDVRTDTNDNGGGKGLVSLPGTEWSPMPPSARAPVQRANEPASVMCAPMTDLTDLTA